MSAEVETLLDELQANRSLDVSQYRRLIECFDEDAKRLACEAAVRQRKRVYGTEVFVRGLIEIGNRCKNDCLYCGIRCSNRTCRRYRLSSEEIARCVDEGYDLGFRTFVLQGGEDPAFTDELLCRVVDGIKDAHPDCAVTLSVGERSRASYRRLHEAGADRYLLRHEAANPRLYERLHPARMSWNDRMRCLYDLREIGYAVGCGFMVGAPGQTAADLACDLKFLEEFAPQMCGIGPFIPHHATPFSNCPHGSVSLTCFLVSLLRLISPGMLIPATTALGTLDADGQEKGIMAGANVVMPNLTTEEVRSCYELYDGKKCTGGESAQEWANLEERMKRIGYDVSVDRGDPRIDSGTTELPANEKEQSDS